MSDPATTPSDEPAAVAGPRARPEVSRLAAWLVPVVVAAAWCALILFVHRDSPRTLVSAHGLLHAAIAHEFADPTTSPPLATPPENPLFAGQPLPYYYFFQLVGARVAALLHVDVIHAFEALIVLAAFVTVLLGFWLAHRVHGTRTAMLAAGTAFALLFFAGTNPQGPLVLLARWMKDGGASLQDHGQYLWGFVHPINGAMRIGDYWGALGPLATYFFNVTARPLALASLVLVIAMLALALRHSAPARPLALAGVALATAFCTLWSPLLGLASAGGLAAALVLQALTTDRATARAARTDLLAAAALLVGAALAWPWYRHLLGGAGGVAHLEFNPKRALGVVASCWLLALLAAGQPRWGLLEGLAITRVLKIAGLLLAIPTAFVALPVGNEDNFLHAALVCWAVVAASAAVPDPDGEVVCEPGGG